MRILRPIIIGKFRSGPGCDHLLPHLGGRGEQRACLVANKASFDTLSYKVTYGYIKFTGLAHLSKLYNTLR